MEQVWNARLRVHLLAHQAEEVAVVGSIRRLAAVVEHRFGEAVADSSVHSHGPVLKVDAVIVDLVW